MYKPKRPFAAVRSRLHGASTRAVLVLTLLATPLLGGCAFGARQASLRYPPQAESGGTAVAAAQAAPATAAPTKAAVVVAAFTDTRKDKGQVGSVRNGFGMPTAQILTSDSVPQWVDSAVRTELTRGGYRVVDGAAPATGAVSVLSGDITNVWADAYFSYNAEVDLALRLRRDDRELLAKTYIGQGSAGTNWGATAAAYSQSLSLALADALRQLMADVDKALSSP